MANSTLLKTVLLFVTYLFRTTSADDWLVDKIIEPVTFTNYQQIHRLQNGLIRRDFITSPNFATVCFFSVERDQSLIRALEPEAITSIDGITYNIGGVIHNSPRAYMNRTDLYANLKPDPNAFQFVRYETMAPVALFPYTPKRGAPKDIQWPPKGLRVDIMFKPPVSAPPKHQKIIITVHYEMYIGMPLLAKWITVSAPEDVANNIKVALQAVEILSVNKEWGPVNPKLGESSWLFVQTDQAHGTSVNWITDPAQPSMPGSFEPTVNCSYNPIPNVTLGKDGFESFKVLELVIGSSDPQRSALARLRMLRTLAPHTQENPIFFHMTKSDSASVRPVIDQMAEVGFEMMIYSFGGGFNLESDNTTYIKQVASDITYAKSKGIEVGGYDLIALTRNVQAGWMAVDNNNHSIGSACFASGWYDYLLTKTLTFMDKTGLIMVETDGPYGGYSCSSKEHKHHMDESDSIYWQQKLQNRFYTILRTKGVYINQPDNYFYAGGSRTGLGYNENQYSLPRWQDISISRQSVYDDTYTLTPTAGWMFAPLVDYHAGGAAAMFEPLTQHKDVYEWALAQYLGAGTAACYRGYRLYDSEETKALVKKWVDFYKKYRDIITSDLIHIRRPDMQSIDGFMHVNPYIENKALAMVFNPTSMTLTQNLTFPLYYSGLTDKAMVYQEGVNGKQMVLDRGYNVKIEVTLTPLNITWFLFN